MHKDEIKGGFKEAVGKMKDKVGEATENPRLEAEGEADQVEGNIQQGVGKVKNTLHKAID